MPAPRPSTPEERRARMLRELAAEAGGDTRHLALRGSQGMFNRAADKATGALVDVLEEPVDYLSEKLGPAYRRFEEMERGAIERGGFPGAVASGAKAVRGALGYVFGGYADDASEAMQERVRGERDETGRLVAPDTAGDMFTDWASRIFPWLAPDPLSVVGAGSVVDAGRAARRAGVLEDARRLDDLHETLGAKRPKPKEPSAAEAVANEVSTQPADLADDIAAAEAAAESADAGGALDLGDKIGIRAADKTNPLGPQVGPGASPTRDTQRAASRMVPADIDPAAYRKVEEIAALPADAPAVTPQAAEAIVARNAELAPAGGLVGEAWRRVESGMTPDQIRAMRQRGVVGPVEGLRTLGVELDPVTLGQELAKATTLERFWYPVQNVFYSAAGYSAPVRRLLQRLSGPFSVRSSPELEITDKMAHVGAILRGEQLPNLHVSSRTAQSTAPGSRPKTGKPVEQPDPPHIARVIAMPEYYGKNPAKTGNYQETFVWWDEFQRASEAGDLAAVENLIRNAPAAVIDRHMVNFLLEDHSKVEALMAAVYGAGSAWIDELTNVLNETTRGLDHAWTRDGVQSALWHAIRRRTSGGAEGGLTKSGRAVGEDGGTGRTVIDTLDMIGKKTREVFGEDAVVEVEALGRKILMPTEEAIRNPDFYEVRAELGPELRSGQYPQRAGYATVEVEPGRANWRKLGDRDLPALRDLAIDALEDGDEAAVLEAITGITGVRPGSIDAPAALEALEVIVNRLTDARAGAHAVAFDKIFRPSGLFNDLVDALFGKRKTTLPSGSLANVRAVRSFRHGYGTYGGNATPNVIVEFNPRWIQTPGDELALAEIAGILLGQDAMATSGYAAVGSKAAERFFTGGAGRQVVLPLDANTFPKDPVLRDRFFRAVAEMLEGVKADGVGGVGLAQSYPGEYLDELRLFVDWADDVAADPAILESTFVGSLSPRLAEGMADAAQRLGIPNPMQRALHGEQMQPQLRAFHGTFQMPGVGGYGTPDFAGEFARAQDQGDVRKFLSTAQADARRSGRDAVRLADLMDTPSAPGAPSVQPVRTGKAARGDKKNRLTGGGAKQTARRIRGVFEQLYPDAKAEQLASVAEIAIAISAAGKNAIAPADGIASALFARAKTEAKAVEQIVDAAQKAAAAGVFDLKKFRELAYAKGKKVAESDLVDPAEVPGLSDHLIGKRLKTANDRLGKAKARHKKLVEAGESPRSTKMREATKELKAAEKAAASLEAKAEKAKKTAGPGRDRILSFAVPFLLFLSSEERQDQ